MFDEEELHAAADFLESHFDLDGTDILPGEYYYTCLPLCLLDAIFSIGSNYSATARTVRSYCEAYDIPCQGTKENRIEVSHGLSDLVQHIKEEGVEGFAANVLKNKQRTSSRNGILKAEAVLKCADVLLRNGIDDLSDFRSKLNDTVESQFMEITGQGSGTSLKYLKMLCGERDTLKPDRHITRFLKACTGETVDVKNAEPPMRELLAELNKNHPNLTMRELDYIIWNYQRQQGSF